MVKPKLPKIRTSLRTSNNVEGRVLRADRDQRVAEPDEDDKLDRQGTS